MRLAQDARALRDGCEPCTVCPPGIRKCAHYDGKVVWLGDHVAGAAHVLGRDPERWGITGPGVAVQCSCPTDHVVMDSGGYFRTDDLPAAEAEFARLERALLGRSEP